MARCRIVHYLLLIASVPLLCPQLAHALEPQQKTRAATAPDVVLTGQGMLQGRLVNRNGQPLANSAVVVTAGQRRIATKTDANGFFQAELKTSGLYAVSAAGGVITCRAWSTRTAPPVAQQGILLVSDEQTLTAQGPRGFFTNPIVIGGVIAAAVGITIAVASDDDDDPPPVVAPVPDAS